MLRGVSYYIATSHGLGVIVPVQFGINDLNTAKRLAQQHYELLKDNAYEEDVYGEGQTSPEEIIVVECNDGFPGEIVFTKEFDEALLDDEYLDELS